MNNTEKLLAAESLIKQATLRAMLTGAKNYGRAAVSGLGNMRNKVTKYLDADIATPPDKISQDYADWIKLNPAAHPTRTRREDLSNLAKFGGPTVASALWANRNRQLSEQRAKEPYLRNNPPFRSAEKNKLPYELPPTQVPFRPFPSPAHPPRVGFPKN
jgi:hypothetical protein